MKIMRRKMISLSAPAPCRIDNGTEEGERGDVTLRIDFLTDGERIKPGPKRMDTRPFYVNNPDCSMLGKSIWDIMRSEDFLQSLEFVNSDRIGCPGWSPGGHGLPLAARTSSQGWFDR